jgi:enoyl-CoA hydratase
MNSDVLYETHDGIATITLNRPRYYNAQSWKLLEALDEALERAASERDVRVAVVRGAGKHFSSGHDLGTPEQLEDEASRSDITGRGEGIEFYEQFRKVNLDFTLKWRNLPIPTIAMVQGYCIYGGWMIAASMDVIFAARDALFLAGLFEYFSVPWDIPARKAKELILESRFIDAEEARELGLVNRVYDMTELESATYGYATRVAENPRTALRMGKLAINKAQDAQGFSANMEAAFADFMLAYYTDDNWKRSDERRLGGVDLALRGLRGERAGLVPGQPTDKA